MGRRLGLDHAQAEELAQEVLLAACDATFESRPGATYWDWLAVIARRKARRMLEVVERELPVRRRTTPWSGVCRLRLLEVIDEMPTHRVVLVRLAAGYCVAEIAQELGLTSAAVHMRITRGRKWLLARGF